MTVDLLAATFWPEGALFGCRHPQPHEGVPIPGEPGEPGDAVHPDAADAAARAEGFWAAMVRHVWRPSEGPALP